MGVPLWEETTILQDTINRELRQMIFEMHKAETAAAKGVAASTGCIGSFPLTVTVTTMGYRSYKNPLNKAPLRTVTGRGTDPRDAAVVGFRV